MDRGMQCGSCGTVKLRSVVACNETERSGCSSFDFVGGYDWWLGRGALRCATASSARMEATTEKERSGMEVVAGMLVSFRQL